MTADLHAEQAVIGAVLLDARALDVVRTIISPDDFHRGAHRSIYEAVLHLAAEGIPVDAVTVTDELERRGHLADVGGTAEISKMISSASGVTKAAAGEYARIVAEKSVRRRLQAIGAEVAAKAPDPSVPLDDIRQLMADLPTERTGTIRCLSSRELDKLPKPEWLIKGVLPKGLVVVYGPSGSGKSLIVQDWGWCMASGRKWFGKDITKGRMLYVAGEGHEGLQLRRGAWMSDRAAGTDGWYCIPDPVDILNPSNVDELSAWIDKHGASVVALDTLAMTMGGNENETPDMNRYVQVCRQIRARHNVTVIVIHHTGVDQTRMRGNQSLFAAADTVIRVEPDKGQVKVSQPDPPAGKAKDAPRFAPFFFGLKEVDLGFDDDGERVTSVVLSTGPRLAAVPEPPPVVEPSGERELAW